ncbi:MAG: GGDEF domain-containing protein [Desulfobacteraceae bacterium]|nr:MAG: GGDEF domain-containing protein [Desulfobacteraceae bacterium]
MQLFDWLRKILENRNDPFASYIARVVLPVGIAALILLIPFAINNFLKGRIGVGIAIVLVQLLLLVDVLALRRGRKPPFHYGLVVVPMIVAMLAAVFNQGILGALWGYPIVLICYFVLSRRVAFLFSLVIMAVLTIAIAIWIEPALAVRIFATMLLTIAIINIVLNLIDELHDALVQQAITDPLTSAFNRRHMNQSIELIVEQGRRHPPNNTLLMLDIDHFKQVNDCLGHDVGDDLLRRLVQTIKGRMRKVDLLFRIGGEEFILLLFDADVTQAAVAADDIRRRVEAAELLPGQPVTISIGLCAQRAGQAADEWIKLADTALYQAKQRGRNRVEIAEHLTEYNHL